MKFIQKNAIIFTLMLLHKLIEPVVSYMEHRHKHISETISFFKEALDSSHAENLPQPIMKVFLLGQAIWILISWVLSQNPFYEVWNKSASTRHLNSSAELTGQHIFRSNNSAKSEQERRDKFKIICS